MTFRDRRRILAAGALWAAVYNLVWGVAWFAFMRREWLDAMAAIKQELPFTPQVWAVWVVLTLPIGVAIMAYVAGRSRSSATAALRHAGTLVVFTMGMVGWGVRDSLSVRVMALDAAVNLIALASATLAGRWSLRD